ncbi:MAG: hypothetical protein AAF383_30970 [Cyanobacteria bacterium P01_A01_bin.83]
MNIEPLTIESKFEVSKFKLYLQQHPEKSHRLAIRKFEYFLVLVQAYKKLMKKYKLLEAEYSELVELLATVSDTD